MTNSDLKPENLLLDADGHLKLIDFGSAKPLFLPPQARRSGNRATSFVGTAEYVSPEVLTNGGVSYASDLWALGCIVYQMLAGRPPFKGASEYLTFQLITARDLSFPEGFPPVAADLVDRLLREQPAQRLGARDLDDLRAHPFFEGIDWQHPGGARAAAPAPALVARAQSAAQAEEDAALDWELVSLFKGPGAAARVRYEYLPTDSPAAAAAGGGVVGGGGVSGGEAGAGAGGGAASSSPSSSSAAADARNNGGGGGSGSGGTHSTGGSGGGGGVPQQAAVPPPAPAAAHH